MDDADAANWIIGIAWIASAVAGIIIAIVKETAARRR